MVMNGEECHNEWEITLKKFKEMVPSSFRYFQLLPFTGDYSYIPEKEEVLIGIAAFWHQRATFFNA